MPTKTYVITGQMLGRLKSAGCGCGSLPPTETCKLCQLIDKVRHDQTGGQRGGA